MRAFDDLVSQGKVLYVGVSDAPAWWVAQANTLASLRGWSPFVGLQIEYSLMERTIERELLPMAKASVSAWSLGLPSPEASSPANTTKPAPTKMDVTPAR